MRQKKSMKRLLAAGLVIAGMQVYAQETNEAAFGKVDEANSWDLRCFPNPTSDLLIIKSSKEIKSVDFFDINGKPFNPTPLPNGCYSLSDLPNGWVFLLIQSADGYVEKKNVYKQ